MGIGRHDRQPLAENGKRMATGYFSGYPKRVILGSNSPRRKELLRALGVEAEVLVKAVDESFPAGLSPLETVYHITRNKAEAFAAGFDGQLVIVADTIVVSQGLILGKPRDEADARRTLAMLSGRAHEVITAVGFVRNGHIHVFHDRTAVHFKALSEEEISHYVTIHREFDKAGAYGIQEWIGLVGVTKIEGSYTNVVGLPTAKVHEELLKLTNR